MEFRAVDAYGNPRPCVTGDVTLTVTGPGILVGETPFAFGDTGGVGAVWIRTVPGAPGTITVRASHPSLGSSTVTIKAVASGSAASGAAPRTAISYAPASAFYPSLAAAFSNVGITADGSTAPGNLDGGGSSYSATALATAGLTPGATVRTPTAWPTPGPTSSPGSPTTPRGRGRPSRSTAGPAPPASVCSPPAPRAKASGGTAATATCVYAVTVPVDPARRVAAVTLPNRSAAVGTLVNAAHIFAITTGTPVVYDSLAAAFNNKGTSDDSDIAAANFDGTGNSYSRQALAVAGLTPARASPTTG